MHAVMDVDFESLLEQAVRRILEHENWPRFVQWMQDNITTFMQATQDRPPPSWRSVATDLARHIWNSTPLPGNGFKPAPVMDPSPGDSCFCGSGRDFQHCCRGISRYQGLESKYIWPFVISALNTAQLRQLESCLNRDDLGPEQVLEVASHHVEHHRLKKAATILQPILQPPFDPGSNSAFALNLLCYCYDQLGYHRKKSRLLLAVSEQLNRSPLRFAALQQLVVMLMQEGAYEQSEAFLRQLYRENPNDPDNALLELQYLTEVGDMEVAKTRALAWQQKLGDTEGTETGEILQLYQRQPAAALLKQQLQALKFSDLIMEVLYQDEQVDIRNHRVLSQQQGGPSAQPATFAYRIQAGRLDALLCVEDGDDDLLAAWRRLFPLDKPEGLSEHPPAIKNPWIGREAQAWLAFLLEHPRILNSFSVLDDVGTALALLPCAASYWFKVNVMEPWLQRSVNLWRRLETVHGALQLAWAHPTSRCLIRSVQRLVGVYYDQGETSRAHRLEYELMQLDPADHYGCRAALVNECLRNGREQQAVRICERFPGDHLLEVSYGRVLAWYRLGDRRQAQEAFELAVQDAAAAGRLLAGLGEETVSSRKLDYFSVSHRAWIYQQTMGDQWLATEGMQSWLGRQLAR